MRRVEPHAHSMDSAASSGVVLGHDTAGGHRGAHAWRHRPESVAAHRRLERELRRAPANSGSVIDWARVLLLCVLLVVLARSTFAREIACEKGPNVGRISVTLAGLLSSRTVEIPESLVRSGDPAAVARLVRPRSRGKVSQIMLEGAASRHALNGIPLHSLSGAFTTVGRWQLDRLYLSLSQRLGPS